MNTHEHSCIISHFNINLLPTPFPRPKTITTTIDNIDDLLKLLDNYFGNDVPFKMYNILIVIITK